MSQWAGTGTIRDRISNIERRLGRIEAHLQMSALEPIVEEAPPFELVEELPVEAEPLEAAPRTAPPPLPVMPIAPAPMPEPVAPARFTPYLRTKPAIASYEMPSPAPPPVRNELEQTIGLKWAGWVGAIVVVIGAGLGIKYAYDQGWFDVLPAAARLALMSLAGFGLIGAGEWVFRQVNRTAAACLYGAGVATLFLVSYAGHGYYRLYEPQTAFLLMGLTTAIGAAVAIRGNLLSIAVLAHIGGNLAPVLLHSDRPMLGSFLTYLLALQVVALVLAWWGRSRQWWTLRWLSLATTSAWVLAAAANEQFRGNAALLTFSVLYAALYQAELLLSARRQGDEAEPAEDPLSASLWEGSPAALSLVFSVTVTALLTSGLLLILRDAPAAARGLCVMGLAGACGVAGFALSRAARASRTMRHLVVGYRMQAAALVVVAVPVALSGGSVVFGWMVLALTFAALGKVLDLPIARWAGVNVWRLAALYLAWWGVGPIVAAQGRQLSDGGAHAVWITLFNQGIPAYLPVAWTLAIAGHVIAWITSQDAAPQSQRRAWLTHVAAGVVWLAASIAALPPAGSTFAILVYAWLLLGADLLDPKLGLVLQSAVVVILVTMKWVAVDTLAERLAPGWSPTARRPVLNSVMGMGVLISATMGALYALRRDVLWASFGRRGTSDADAPFAGSAAAPALALAAALMTVFAIGLTAEIDRVIEAGGAAATLWPVWQLKQMAWTVLWMLCLCGYLALSRGLEPDELLRPAIVRVAEGLAVIVAFKFLLVDTFMFRAFGGAAPAMPVANFQTLTAAVVGGGMVLVAYLMTRGAAPDGTDAASRQRGLFKLAGFLAVLVVLWSGTLELDRAFERLIAFGSGAFADPRLAKQVAFSTFWSLFAVGTVVAGFRFRTAGLRYFGLGLFAFTLLKVVLFDLSHVQTGYRVLSFLGLGLLLMGTSVLYGKLSPVLLRAGAAGGGDGTEEGQAGMIFAGQTPPRP